MIIYPALDIRGGKIVRLREGDPARQTVFSEDPVEIARRWIDGGAQWLHVVNLDGAFADAMMNSETIRSITALEVPVQFGGGIRSEVDVVRAFDYGVTRVVIGTAAVEKPELVEWAVQTYGSNAVCVALDARDGKVSTHGWQQSSDMTPAALGLVMAERGVKHALYTDIGRDGGLSGVNIEGTIALAQETGLAVIASGGVTRLDEIEMLAGSGQIAGTVIGMALYSGAFTLPDALRRAARTKTTERN